MAGHMPEYGQAWSVCCYRLSANGWLRRSTRCMCRKLPRRKTAGATSCTGTACLVSILRSAAIPGPEPGCIRRVTPGTILCFALEGLPLAPSCVTRQKGYPWNPPVLRIRRVTPGTLLCYANVLSTLHHVSLVYKCECTC